MSGCDENKLYEINISINTEESKDLPIKHFLQCNTDPFTIIMSDYAGISDVPWKLTKPAQVNFIHF